MDLSEGSHWIAFPPKFHATWMVMLELNVWLTKHQIHLHWPQEDVKTVDRDALAMSTPLQSQVSPPHKIQGVNWMEVEILVGEKHI